MARRGSFSLQLLVLLVPVFFGLMGFAVDLGRLYLIKGELNQAASAMALTAATQLIGTAGATGNADTASSEILDDTTGHAARYNFGADLIGQSTGFLTSTVNQNSYFASLADALGTGGGSGTQADGTTARHVQVTLSADAPLLFWSLISLGRSHSTPVGAIATAGISAPVCQACQIVPFAVQPVDPSDTADFGFVAGAYYTFAYQCNANPPANPAPQPFTGNLVSYILIDHYDPANAADDETQQLYIGGANGLLAAPPSDQTAAGFPMSCVTIGTAEALWGSTSGGSSASPMTCGTVPTVVQDMLCGMYSRLDPSQSPPAGCANSVTDASTLAGAYLPDPDVSNPDVSSPPGDYSSYTGNGRRIITVPLVDAFGTLDVLGFRQFLVLPNPDGSGNLNPADSNGRFVAMYMGMSPVDSNTTPAPVRQGSISCPSYATSPGTIQGPGKVVLHQ